MKVKTQYYDNVTVIALQGDLDSDSVDLFKNSIGEAISKNRSGMVLDMGGVSFIDSEGLEKILWARDYCNENNSQLKIAGLDENCKTILQITQLDNEFDIYSELSDAAKSFV